MSHEAQMARVRNDSGVPVGWSLYIDGRLFGRYETRNDGEEAAATASKGKARTGHWTRLDSDLQTIFWSD